LDSLSFAVEIFYYVILFAGSLAGLLALFSLFKAGKRYTPVFIRFTKILCSVALFIFVYRLIIFAQILSILIKIGMLCFNIYSIKTYAAFAALLIVRSFSIKSQLMSFNYRIKYGLSPNKRKLILRGKLEQPNTSNYFKFSPVLIS